MRKKFTMLLASLFLVIGSTWAQKLVTSVEEGKYYTLQCNSSSHTGFLGENDLGFNGQSAPVYLIFEAVEGGYHVKSALTGKYLNQGVSIEANKYDVAYSATASTVWTIGKLTDDATDIYLTIGDTKFYLNNNKGDGQKLQILKHDAIGTGNACSLWEMREHEDGYKVIESIGENITSLNQLTDGSYVAFYNVGKSKYIYEGMDHKLWMGTDAVADAGHEYIFRVRKEGDKYAFMAMSGRYISTPLDGYDVITKSVDDNAKDEFTIAAHGEDNSKWKLQSTNNGNLYWDAQDARFVGWQGNGTNSRYEIRPVAVKDSEHALADFITADENIIKWVNIKNMRCGKYAHYEGESTKMSLKDDKESSKSYFYLTGEIRKDGHPYVKIHNYRTNSLCNETNGWTVNGREWTIQSSAGENIHPGYAITKGTDLGNNGNSWNNEGGSGNAIAYWNGNDQGSTWAFEAASYPALLARLEGMKTTALTPAITAAQTAYEDGAYTETAITLTAEQLYCNAPYTAQNNGDNAGVGALVDGQDNTYLHTDYSGNNSADGEDHYIRVDLGENSAVKYYTFNYKTRHNADGNNPRVIVVEGSNSENGEYYPVATLTEADGLPITGSGASYKSPVLGGHAYRYVRFKVTDTNNHSEKGGHKFFSLASFGMNEVTVKEGSEVKTFVYANMPKSIDEAQSVLVTQKTTEEEINSAAEKLNTIVAGLTVQTYPFTLTTDVNHPVCYHIKSGRTRDWSSEGVFYWTFIDGKMTTITATSGDAHKKDVETYWFFMENPKNGQLQLVPFIEHTKPMGYTTVSDAADKITNNTSASGFVGTGYTLVTNTSDSWAEYPYALKPYGGNTYVSNNQGKSGQYMGFWNGHADGGTRFELEETEIVPSAKLRDLRTALASCPVIPAEHIGTSVGLYDADNYAIYASVVDPARAAYNDATLTSEEYYAHLVAFDNDPTTLLTVKAPQVGKFYRLKNVASGNYMAGNKEDIKLLANVDNGKVATIFYLGENNTLLSYNSGRYLDCYNKTYSAIGTALKGEFGFAYGGPTAGIVTYKNNGAWTYGAGADGAGLDRGTGTPNNAGYNWTFEEVTWLPVAMNATVGYATLYSPVELELSYERVKAYTGKIVGEKLALIEQTIVPANTGVVLELQEGAAVEDGFVFLQVQESTTSDVESDLIGSYAKSVKNANVKVYTLQCPDKENADESTGFYLFKGQDANGATTYINGFRAWLEVPIEEEAPAMFSFGRGQGTTSIDDAVFITNNAELIIYDLTGRRVEKMDKGIYIVNGKKVVIK